MLQVKNIIVGSSRIYLASVGTALPTFNTTGGSVKNDFAADANWDDLGFTSEGLQVAYEPTYSDIPVDQYKDAAKVFLESETMNFSTTLMETTLENLAVAWGRNQASSIAVDGETKTFSLGVGPDVACEYSIAVVGPAPGSVADCDADGNPVVVERVYNAFRVISVEGSTHSLSRTEATMFPVTFRCLPYDMAPAGAEYAQIHDYNVSAADMS